jgi:hypothetical protein
MGSTRRESHEVENFVGLIRLLNHRERTGGPGAVSGRGIGPAADHDDRKPIAASAHAFEQLEATHPRHMDVDDQAVPVARPDGVEELSAGCKFMRLEAFAFEQKPK